MRVITRNSVYLVTPVADGFHVRRIADMWGRAVRESHSHVSRSLEITVGGPMRTDTMTTSTVSAVVAPAF
jgi:hypothetical protein